MFTHLRVVHTFRPLGGPLALLASLVLSAAPLTADEPAPSAAKAPRTAPAPNAAPVPPDHVERIRVGTDLFKAEVRTLLTARCLRCHGGTTVEGNLNLATREGFVKGGERGPAFVSGKGETSLVTKLIRHAEPPEMPHDEKRLSDKEIATIVRWIDLGAPYDRPLVQAAGPVRDDAWTERRIAPADREHWAFRPLQKATPPTVKHEALVRTPIDRFVLAAQEAKDLAPNPEADRRTLIRRATLDLIGLPPTPEEVDAFVGDESPGAWDKVLDRLLADRRHGERWARYWLDVARFAESHGFEQDYDRPFAYHYRDFVVRALNDDMPYDQFVRWQVAGDELAPQDPLALMATGFLGAGVFPTQITANEVERTRYDALDDMASTLGTAFLGLTVGCARCHDHKFDPIPQADYFRLVSVFTTTVRSNVPLDLEPGRFEQEKAAFDSAHAVLVEARAKYERDSLRTRFDEWERNEAPRLESPAWRILDRLEIRPLGKTTFDLRPDGTVQVGGENPNTATYEFTATATPGDIAAIRLEALSDPAQKNGGPGRAPANGNFALSTFEVAVLSAAKDAQPVPVKFAAAHASFEQKGLPVAAAIDADPVSAWAIDPQFGRDQSAVFVPQSPIALPAGARLRFVLKFENNKQHGLARLRLAVTHKAGTTTPEGAALPDRIARILSVPREQRTPEDRAELLAWYGPTDPEWRRLDEAVRKHLARAPQRRLTEVMICSEGVKPIRHHTQGADFFEQTFFCKRGDTDQKLKPAAPGFLQVLMRSPEAERHWQVAPPTGAKTSFRRTGLANWLVDTEQGAGHLLARVMVNRLWQHHFGQGLVATSSDFGRQGTPPSHPELLDWLAQRLIDEGWRLKPLHRLVMQSRTYRLSGARQPKAAAVDPGDRLLTRLPARRLEAEAIRDAILSVSGLLDPTMSGPGTLDENHVRRSLYFTVKRSKLIPMMQVFDAPDALVGQGERVSTTIAPQALLLLNAPLLRRSAESFAQRSAPAEDVPTAEAVSRAYRLALGRTPDAEESSAASQFLAAQTASYVQEGRRDARRKALADFCQVLFGLNEFVYRP